MQQQQASHYTLVIHPPTFHLPKIFSPKELSSFNVSEPLSMRLVNDGVLVNDDLRIFFRRTVRVPGDYETAHLPPDRGAFPLKRTARHTVELQLEMAAKSGVLFSVYREYPRHDQDSQCCSYVAGQNRRTCLQVEPPHRAHMAVSYK